MKYEYSFDPNGYNAPAYIAKRIKPNSIVLEFGTAHGILTSYLNNIMNCDVYGVELDFSFAELAKPYTKKMFVGDIELYEWKDYFKEQIGMFDYIIFADVLEHLIDPHRVLRELYEFLNDTGVILLSIPNIAHNAIVMNLYENKFDYGETGLLDKTHLRFFTRNSIKEMIQESGYFISYEAGIYIAPSKTEFSKHYSDIPLEISKVLRWNKYGEVYQFIFEISRNASDNIILDYENKTDLRVVIAGENGNDIIKKIHYRISFEEIENFRINLNECEPFKSIHISIDNVPSLFKIERISLDNDEIKSFNINADKKVNDFWHSKTDFLEIFIPFLDDKIGKYLNITFSFDQFYEQRPEVINQSIEKEPEVSYAKKLVNWFWRKNEDKA
jgi:2-polyprenyl-3-methyl-5-hydroxy-6-metoxy-1,4-benzoquinol methylase